jgi:hypothetical protein
MHTEVTIPIASKYVLADAIHASFAERQLFTTLHIQGSGSGALLVLRTGLRAFEGAAREIPSVRSAEWVNLHRGLTERVAEASKSAPWLGIHSPTQVNEDSQGLSTPVRSKLPKECQDRLYAWLGVHMFKALSQGTSLSSRITADWGTLLRSDANKAGRSNDWVQLAARMPLNREEIESKLADITNARAREALQKTLAALDADLPEPSQGPQVGDTDERDVDLDIDIDIDADEDKAHLPRDPDASARSASQAQDAEPRKASQRHSLLGWILKTAAYGGYRTHFGIAGLYGTLPPPELRQTCIALMASMSVGTLDDRSKVAVAEISLKSSLPPKLALSVPLTRNGDIWLDLLAGAIVWNYRAVVDTGTTSDLASGCPVHIRLSDKTVQHLSQIHCLNPAARTLADLLCLDGLAGTKHWLAHYGQFLRGHGDQVYKAYSARFANSYHSVYHDRNHGPIFAAFLSLDFSALPPGALHYVNIPARRLIDCQRDVDGYLGFEWADRRLEGAF